MAQVKALACTLVLFASFGANSAMAIEKGDWLWRFRASTVDPKSDNHDVVGVDSASSFTTFFNTKTVGSLEGLDLDQDDSFDLAGEVGADIILNDTWFLSASFRYIDIETDAKLDGAKLGTVKIDPYVYGIHVGMKF